MSDYATNSTLGQFKTHEGDYSIEEEIFKIIGGTLKEKEQKLRDTIDNQREEIDRLNNIIDELEKELNKKIEAIKTIKDMLGEEAKIVNPHIEVLETEYKYFLDKLKALKEE